MMHKSLKISDSFATGNQLAVLVDPDHFNESQIRNVAQEAQKAKVDYIFVGGSLLHNPPEKSINLIKSETDIPVILFPGNAMHVTGNADAILFLSLISGRNPEYLIGHHVNSAPYIKRSGIEVLPTAYILIENGRRTSVEYISNTIPIPADKSEIVVATAMAGEMLGLRFTYLEAGSGAVQPVGQKLIKEVRKNTGIPLIVGGGIRSAEEASLLYASGAGLIVVGNAIEENSSLIKSISSIRQ